MSNDDSMFTLGFSPRSNRKASPGFVGGKGERPRFVVRSHERIGGSMTWKANEFSHGTGPARPCCSSMHRRRVKAIGVCDIVGAPRVGALSRRNRRLITAATVFASTRCSSVNDSLGDEGDCPTPSTPRVRWRLGMMVRGGAPAARRPRMFRCHTRSGHPRMMMMMMMMMLVATCVDTARSNANGWRRSLEASIPRCTSARVVVVILGGGSGAVVRWDCCADRSGPTR